MVWLAVLLLVAAAAFLWWPRTVPQAESAEVLPPGAEPIASAPFTGVPGADGASAPGSTAVVAAPVLGEPPIAAGAGASAPSVAGGAAPGVPAMADAAPALAGAAASAAAVPATVPAASAPALPILATLPGAAPAAAAPGGEALVLRAVSDSWVQVTDASGKVLLGRTMPAGETLAFDGPWPMKVRIGNAHGTELVYRGQAIDLKAMTRDNTLRLTLPPQ